MMNESRYLAGQVIKRSLSLYESRPDAAAPPLKRLNLGQGELAQVHDGDPPVRYVAALELRAGGVRGNHYHLAKRESLYVIRGEIELALEDLATGLRESIGLTSGDLVVLPPRIAHALRTLSPGWAMEFAPDPLDPADSHRRILIAP